MPFLKKKSYKFSVIPGVKIYFKAAYAFAYFLRTQINVIQFDFTCNITLNLNLNL